MTTLDPRALDALAQEIRRVDGSHDLGAGALAEALSPFVASLSQPQAGEPSAQSDFDQILAESKGGIDRMLRGFHSMAAPQPALAVKGLPLQKLPVEFRVRAQGQWLHFENEQDARDAADMHGVDYQGLYVRDGTGCEMLSSLSRVTKGDDGYLHEWIDADGEQHSYVHPTNLSRPAPDAALVASPPPSGVMTALHNAKVLLTALTGPDDALAQATIADLDAALSVAPSTADGWRTMEEAPKDGTKILVCYDAKSDPYVEDEKTGRLTPYGAHSEGGDFLDGTGITVAVWVDGWYESEDEYGSGYWMPGWWFAWFNGDTDLVVAPTGWLPLDRLPAAPTATGGR